MAPIPCETDDFTLALFPEQIRCLPAGLRVPLSLLLNITDVEFWLMSVIHYEEVDRTLSLNQFDSPTLSIDSHWTRSGGQWQIEMQINKKPHGGNSRIFCGITVCALSIESAAFYRNPFLYQAEHNSCLYSRVLPAVFNISAQWRTNARVQGKGTMLESHINTSTVPNKRTQSVRAHGYVSSFQRHQKAH